MSETKIGEFVTVTRDSGVAVVTFDRGVVLPSRWVQVSRVHGPSFTRPPPGPEET